MCTTHFFCCLHIYFNKSHYLFSYHRVCVCVVCLCLGFLFELHLHSFEMLAQLPTCQTEFALANCFRVLKINRGVSGFDSSGHGHYFASYPNSHNNHAQPSLPQNHLHQQAPPRPIGQQQGGQHHDSAGHSHHSQHSQHSYESDTLDGHSNSNSNKGTYGNWNYINSNDRNSVHHGQQGYGQTQDKDSQQR